MKQLQAGIFTFLLLLTIISCKKTSSFIDSPDALLSLSTDTLHFETVFTSTGSITQSFKIFNQNDQKLKLSAVKLMGGSSSSFKMNVDGSPGASFSNLEIQPNDSIYVFVSVTINPNAANTPFIVQDSILISYNGNNTYLQLDAYGKNAHFLNGVRVTTDSTWTNDLPYVILGNVTVDSNVTLTIQKGCKIFHHADAPFVVNGTLHINGEAPDSLRVAFAGDRLDEYYRDLPGSWPGIQFTSSSKNNMLVYATILNAINGITTEKWKIGEEKLTLHQCIINNCSDAGILSLNSLINAVNCLISNCGGSNVSITGGGKYAFDYCTVVSFGNLFIDHKKPVLAINDADENGVSSSIDAVFRNCIFYGDNGIVNNEVEINKEGTSFLVKFDNVLYYNLDSQPALAEQNSIRNEDPAFVNIDISKRIFDFNLKNISKAINAGIVIPGIVVDLDGKPRIDATSGKPDLGCYENQ